MYPVLSFVALRLEMYLIVLKFWRGCKTWLSIKQNIKVKIGDGLPMKKETEVYFLDVRHAFLS